MIAIESVCKHYGEASVVAGVSLTLAPGGVTAIIGPNGAGKSTLLSLVARLVPMSAGRVEVAGLDVTTTRGDILARHLSILRQDNHVGSRLTVRDLVAFGRYPHSKGRTTREDLVHVSSALAYLDLKDLAERFLDELSGGQRQRAFVAMLIAQDTEAVLLDEPLNNLDMVHASAMMKLVRRLADELGRTVVVVLHDVNFASCYCDHIVAMKNGRVCRQGPPEEIVTSEALHAIYGMQMQVRELDIPHLGVRRICLPYA
ncbi:MULTISPECIES: ABC transporter ATP-binding protein [unclassified Aureimonas]|uniref:iron ABC transporter ATP-binding protein n=1 Tax=unclassified Aureimonas TaxID=2615206 RepID=UPI0006F62EE6|nr:MULTISPECIES: ATP-binding cassette domain-containing protein [unclassified Aureimonas]KQT60713.1 iron ABC transporter ATP-binding protein [Aureimonas sp. Leaf460]KQT68842.1 iron ABC transporter ATP-binding protein [Aureimonas sp. Leaf427]